MPSKVVKKYCILYKVFRREKGQSQQKPITQWKAVNSKLIEHCCTRGTQDISRASETTEALELIIPVSLGLLNSFEAMAPASDQTLSSLPLSKDTEIVSLYPSNGTSDNTFYQSGSQQILISMNSSLPVRNSDPTT